MPRAKPNRRWVGGWIHGPGLPRTAASRAALQDLAGYARIESRGPAYVKLCAAVDAALSNVPGAERLNQAPRPANQTAALAEMKAHSLALRRSVDDLDSRTRNLLEIVRVPTLLNLMHFQRQLNDLVGAITLVDRQLEGANDSRGATPQEGLRFVVARLGRAFQRLERGDADDYETRLRDFIVCACRIVGVPLPRKDRVLALIEQSSVKVPRTAR